jgi:hypothetical protein
MNTEDYNVFEIKDFSVRGLLEAHVLDGANAEEALYATENDDVTLPAEVGPRIATCTEFVAKCLRNGRSVVCICPEMGPSETRIVGPRFELTGRMRTDDINVCDMRECKLSLYDRSGASKELSCSGDINDGEFGPGKCELILPQQGLYIGEMRESRPHGKGLWMQEQPSCASYDGEWRDGHRHGHGIQRYNKQEHYEGKWVQDRWHGSGTLTHIAPQNTTLTHIINCNNGTEISRITPDQLEISKLRQKLTGIESGNRTVTCSVCYSAPVSCVLRPCGHSCTCAICADKIATSSGKCPVCRWYVRKIEDVIIS